MTDRTQRRRRSGLSLEQRVWRLLRREPIGWSPREVAAHMDIDVLAAGTALRRLVTKGSATRVGKAHAIRYYATDVRPEDWRGAAAGSLRALREHGPFQRKTRRVAENRPRRLRSDCMLAEVWRPAQ